MPAKQSRHPRNPRTRTGEKSGEGSVTRLIKAANVGEGESINAVVKLFRAYIAVACLNSITSKNLKRSESELAASVSRIIKTKFLKGSFATVADREEFRKLLVTIIEQKALDVLDHETAAMRNRNQIDDATLLDALEDKEALPAVAAAGRDFLDNIKLPLLPWERAMIGLRLENYEWSEIPRKLRPEFGKVTPYMITCAREKLKRIMTRELAALQ